QTQSFQSLWEQADQRQTREEYAAAEQSYKDILSLYPDSQRTALRIAITQQKQQRYDDALVAYDNAISMDPLGDWAAVAIFYKARAASEAGDLASMVGSLEMLNSLHPDSSYCAQGR